jgi:hypothetical protein
MVFNQSAREEWRQEIQVGTGPDWRLTIGFSLKQE